MTLTFVALFSLFGVLYIFVSKQSELDVYIPLLALLFAWSFVGVYWFKAKEALLGTLPDSASRWQRWRYHLAAKLAGGLKVLFFIMTLGLLVTTFRILNFVLA